MTTNTETALATRTQMQTALGSIDTKLKALKATADSPFKTNGEFRFNPAYTANSPINIHKSTGLRMLIGVMGYLLSQKQKYDEAATKLNVKTYPVFEWLGFTYEAWENDLQIRVAIVTQHEEIQKLKTAKAKLEQFLTEEDRLAIVLDELKDLLG